ncbi:MAG: methyl-accepting chemotaxis protein [Oceanobacter sp.]
MADEVRSLAVNTREATASISKLIEGFAATTNTMASSADDMVDVSQSVHDATLNFENSFSSLANIAQQTYQRVSYSGIVSYASLIKVDHMIYIQNGYRAVEDGPGSDAWKAVSVDHHNCRFGNWYENGIGYEYFSHLPSYAAISPVHEKVHTIMHGILHCMEQGDWRENLKLHDQIRDGFQELETSNELINLVDKMTEEKLRFEAGGASDTQDNEIELF